MKNTVYKSGRTVIMRNDDSLVSKRGAFREIEAVNADHHPSWKRSGGGTAVLRLGTHTDNPYLSFDVEEIAYGAGSKRVMVTLEKEAAAYIVNWIKESFPDV